MLDMETYTQQWNKEGYIRFTNGYSDNINLDLGSWVDLKASDLGLTFDIIHNLPLQSYNYEYKFHEDLSPVVLLLKPQLIKQAVDIVFDSMHIHTGYPKELQKGDVVIYTKRDLFKAIMQNKKNIYAVAPKNNAKLTDHFDFCMEMQDYKENLIKKIVYKKAMNKSHKILEILSTK